MIIGLLFIIWGVYVFGYGIYVTAKNNPGSDGMGWFLAFLNIFGGLMFTVSGVMLFNVSTQPVVALAGGAKKLMGW
jgi:uncharacterized membrane protein